MTSNMTDLLAGFLLILVVIDLGIQITHPSWFDDWMYAYGVVYVIITFFLAVGCYIRGDRLLCGLYSFYCVSVAYMWWHNDRNKRKRKKLLDRAAGRVKDIGGRLKVVRPSET